MIHGKMYRTSTETHCGLPLERFVIFMLPLPDGSMGECYAENVQEWLDGEICPVCENASPPAPEGIYQDAGEAPGPDLCAHCEERPREDFKCSRCRLDLCEQCGIQPHAIIQPVCIIAEVRRDRRDRDHRANCSHQFEVSTRYPGRNVRVCSKCDLMEF